MDNKAKIKEAKHILNMIEKFEIDAVEDVYALNRIDQHVQALSMGISTYDMRCSPSFSPINYTRSRDALKPIRPDGFRCLIDLNRCDDGRGASVCWAVGFLNNKGWFYASTEELAELQAILQAHLYV